MDAEKLKIMQLNYAHLAKEIRGLIWAHEWAIRGDGGNLNIQVMEIRLKEAKKMLPELLSELKTEF